MRPRTTTSAILLAVVCTSASANDVIPRHYPTFSQIATLVEMEERGEHQGYRYTLDRSSGLGGVYDRDPDDSQKKWTIFCSVDRMKDTRVCFAKSGDLWVYEGFPSGVVVVVGEDHHPGRKAMLRIDKQRYRESISAGGIFTSPHEIVQQLRKGRVALTRYTEWPDKSWTDGEVDLGGFSVAHDIIRWASKAPIR